MARERISESGNRGSVIQGGQGQSSGREGGTLSTQPTSQTTGQVRKTLTPQAIATLAFAKWEAAGSPHGRDKEFWYAAEAELQQAAGARR